MNNPRKLKILLSAFSCEPRRGSEPAVGWNIARTLAKHHEVWVLTHKTDNYPVIQEYLAANPIPNLNFVFYEVNQWVKIHEITRLGEQVNYYLWQIGAYFVAGKLQRRESFDLMQHITFVRYWTPTFLNLLGVPFIWGPVGGGESTPHQFAQDFSLGGRMFEFFRNTARKIGELDPFVRLAARKSLKIVATTKETEARVRHLGAKEISVISQCALNEEELDHFGQAAMPDDSKLRFISIGRLLHWKGFYLGLRAFAKANIENAEYWIIGTGPDEKHLKTLADELGILDKVRFFGALSRTDTFARLGESHVLVHPSLHDSGSFACLEAMAARRPVICLDLGGPAVIVSNDGGIKVSAENPAQAVNDIAAAMISLAGNPELREQMGERARTRAVEMFNWEKKIEEFNNLYAEIFQNVETAAESASDKNLNHSQLQAE